VRSFVTKSHVDQHLQFYFVNCGDGGGGSSSQKLFPTCFVTIIPIVDTHNSALIWLVAPQS
jgi:hypothetical protein